MIFAAAALAAWLAFPDMAAEQSTPATRTTHFPHFSDFPVPKLFSGPIADPKFKDGSDEHYLGRLLSSIADSPNFSGQFRLVQFRLGDGPVGAVVFDSETGSIYRLPHEIVRDDFFVHGTDCLPALHGLKWAKLNDEDDASAPLSFKATSELLVVRQCRVDGTTERAVVVRYYRWHGRKWHFLKRGILPPPPVF